MFSFILLIVLFSLTLLFTAMLTALRGVSLAFVRYWARTGDDAASRVYVLKVKGQEVIVLLELLRAVCLTGAVILLSVLTSPFLAWLIASVILMLSLLILPQAYLKPTGMRLLAAGSGLITRLTVYFKPVTGFIGHWLDKMVDQEPPLSLTKEELTKQLESTEPDDTDLTADELRLLKHAMTYGTKTVHAVMTPKRVINSVKSTDVLSPALLDELHKTGHSRFPVFGDGENEVVGILYIRDLIDIKNNATAGNAMRDKIFYVNEERELDHVLQAFIRTKHHLFMVTNAFAEITGLITIEDVLEQVIGRSIVDEFDEYHDLRAVAAKQAREVVKHNKHKIVE